MSYYEIKSFTEKMRTLGYPKSLPVSTFFQPNFQAMSEILKWLIESFSNSDDNKISNDLLNVNEYDNIDLSHETGRVMFVKKTVSDLASKMNIKMNTKKLYSADVSCISELNKLVKILYTSMIEANENFDLNVAASHHSNNQLQDTLEGDLGDITNNDKMKQDIKNLQHLSNNVSESKNQLLDYLEKEIGSDLNDSEYINRKKSVGHQLSHDYINKQMKEHAELIRNTMANYQEQINLELGGLKKVIFGVIQKLFLRVAFSLNLLLIEKHRQIEARNQKQKRSHQIQTRTFQNSISHPSLQPRRIRRNRRQSQKRLQGIRPQLPQLSLPKRRNSKTLRIQLITQQTRRRRNELRYQQIKRY